MPELVHATCIAFGAQGVLLIGPPGSGKSDLALRLIDQPGFGTGDTLLTATLVSDDQVFIERSDATLFASPPASIAGKIEVRGLDILSLRHCDRIQVVAAFEHSASASIERLPEPQTTEFQAVALPLFRLDFMSPSAPARLRAALSLVQPSPRKERTRC
ncbi:HPr kinase/phosphatase C-terminal domain-containing protein [soil metagenome]